MRDKDEIMDILSRFLKNADPKEIQELNELIKRKKKGDMISLDISQMAQKMASNIQSQMGLTTKQIKKMARELVATMILQYDQHISEEALYILLDQMVPMEPPNTGKNMPPEMLMEMVDHFISYSFGRMSETYQSNLPKDWPQKYWENFPVDIQKLHIQLVDQFGRIISLNNMDWALALNFSMLYKV